MTKNKRIILIALLLVFCLIATVLLSACMTTPRLLVSFDDTHTVYEGDSLDSLRPYLKVRHVDMFGAITVVDDYTLSGTLTKGSSVVYVQYEELSKAFNVTVVDNNADDGGGKPNDGDKSDDDADGGTLGITIALSLSNTFIETSQTTIMTVSVSPSSYASEVQYRFKEGEDCVNINNKTLTAKSSGIVKVQAYVGDSVSNTAFLQIVDPNNDPYKNVNTTSFYNNYNAATSLEDSYWRTQHNLMSGSISVPGSTEPTIANNQPMQGDKLVRNSAVCYTEGGNTWEVMDTNGNVVNKIYKFGAYVTLDEVAAYVYAFGDIPANYDSNKNNTGKKGTGGPADSPWGEYLRLNLSYYTNNTTNYPYEPKLPETGPGGTMKYYEIDIGAVGYNNGSTISRNTARIVFTRYYANGNLVDDLEYRYVFYTYNHYNDFQEYLNYQNGWGVRFGNVSNGGTLNQGSNPSPYVDVVRQNFQLLSNML